MDSNTTVREAAKAISSQTCKEMVEGELIEGLEIVEHDPGDPMDARIWSSEYVQVER